MKPTYPRKISDLSGIPVDLDAAVHNPFDGEFYFIKGQSWWCLDTSSLSVSTKREYPQKIGAWWQQREGEQQASDASTRAAVATSTSARSRKAAAAITSPASVFTKGSKGVGVAAAASPRLIVTALIFSGFLHLI